jgi:carbon monoxide dehydrogenase subunit G
MRIAGENTLHAPVSRAWDALLDPAVLVATIPGCERLVATGENSYDMTVTAGVAAIKGTYAGTCVLSDLQEPASLVMKLDGAGAPGTIGATVNVSFASAGDDTTTVTWDADAVVGGMIGGVGQRMLTSVSKRMAGEFFGNVDKALSGNLPAAGVGAGVAAGAEAASAPVAGQVFTAPPSSTAISSQSDFVKGIAVGAGLVLLGVVAGSLFGRRR